MDLLGEDTQCEESDKENPIVACVLYFGDSSAGAVVGFPSTIFSVFPHKEIRAGFAHLL